MKDKPDNQEEEKEEPKANNPKPPTVLVSRSSKSESGLPWLIGAMLILNLLMIYFSAKDKNAAMKPSLWIETLVLWACAFVPGLRYIALILTIPIFVYNVITKGEPLMSAFIGQDKNAPQALPQQQQGDPNVLSPFLPDTSTMG